MPSPTFTLVQIYELERLIVWHVDLYRLTTAAELLELGLEDALDEGALLVEWPDRLPQGRFADRLAIQLDWAGNGTRRTATLAGGPPWARRLVSLIEADKA